MNRQEGYSAPLVCESCRFLERAYWCDAFGHPETRPFLTLLFDLPEEIVHRPKRGFTLPFEHWMRQELRPEIESVLEHKRIGNGPLGELINGAQVERVWKDFLSGTTSWSRPWSLYVLQRWCELHL